MNNKGQTTVFFSIMICALLLFTLTAFEVIRLHTGKLVEMACVHSMRTSIMADYDSELFKRYDLLFINPTYGTDNNAYLEEKIKGYLDASLNEEENRIYQYNIEDIVVSDEVGVLDDDMKLLKQQMKDYGKVSEESDLNLSLTGIKEFCKNTKIPEIYDNEGIYEENTENEDKDTQDRNNQIKDPRDTLSSMLDKGILNIVMPNNSFSSKDMNLSHISGEQEKQKDTGFRDVEVFQNDLMESIPDTEWDNIIEYPSYVNYFLSHFSNGVHPYENTVMSCEIEYLLEGKGSDKENMEEVAKELVWLRMPVNFAYLVTDSKRNKEAEAMAASLCTLTATLEFEKIVKYLLLGCWAYGESLSDVKVLLSGEGIPYIKDSGTWKTDLETLSDTKEVEGMKDGIYYEDYLFMLFIMKSEKQMDDCILRMLDLIELNMQQNNPDFHVADYAGKLQIQGKITMNPLFVNKGNQEIYEYYFDEDISYDMK